MRTLLVAAALCAIASAAEAQKSSKASGPSAPTAVIALVENIKWGPAPAILPAGAKLAVLEGNPMKPGRYTMRLWMPANYRIPPHFHPAWEHVTVIEGAFNVGMGAKFDESAGTTFRVGSFGALPPGMRHFAWTTGPTVIQLHGEGPWSLTYVNRADDPTHKQ